MKKIIAIVVSLLLGSPIIAETTQTNEVITLEPNTLRNIKFSNTAYKAADTLLAINAVQPQFDANINDTLITPEFSSNETPLSTSQRIFNGITQISQDVYHLQIDNTDTAQNLLQDKTTIYFENGPIESVHTWGALQNNIQITMPEEGDTNTKYNVSLINVLFDGKLRGGKETYLLLLDPTPQNKHNFMQNFVKDAYVESNRIPHHKIIVGHSRPGVGFEGSASPFLLPFLNLAQISRNFTGVRKTGLRVRGDYSLVEYDLGGYSSNTYFKEFMPGVEFDGWVNLKPLGKTDGRYGSLKTGGGIVAGERNNTDFVVGGAYVGYDYKKFWTKMEYSAADGSNGATGLTDKRRQGWHATAGYKLTKKLEAVARYDEFDPDKNIRKNNQREYTAGMNYYIKGQALKLVLNYIYCQNQSKTNSHRLLAGFQLLL